MSSFFAFWVSGSDDEKRIRIRELVGASASVWRHSYDGEISWVCGLGERMRRELWRGGVGIQSCV